MTRQHHRAALADLPPGLLYRILRLRVEVFVVEQEAAYAELDGRDDEPGAELLWVQEGDEVLATARVLREHDALRIGRVATAASARGGGLASEVMRQALEVCEARRPGGDVVLDAQAHLAGWYGRFGFVPSGERYLEDGIPHVPMRRPGTTPSATPSATPATTPGDGPAGPGVPVA